MAQSDSLKAMILGSISRATHAGLHDESLASCQAILRDPEREAASHR